MKNAKLSAALAAFALVGFFGSSAPALADPGNGEGALVFNDAACAFLVPNPAGGFYPGLPIPGERKTVTTPSGKFASHCRGEIPENLVPSRPVSRQLSNVVCTITPNGPLRGDATITALPGGGYHGQCHVNGSTDN